MNIELNAVGSPSWLVTIIALLNILFYLGMVFGTATRLFNPSGLSDKRYDVNIPFAITVAVMYILLYWFTGAFASKDVIYVYAISCVLNLFALFYNGRRYKDIPALLYILQLIGVTYFQKTLIVNGYYHHFFN